MGPVVEISVQIRPGAVVPERLLGLTVQPLFPESADSQLGSWLRLRLPDNRDADEVVRRLIELPDVAAAYVKPPESTP